MEKIPSAKKFKRGDRLYVQAQQIWLILVSKVMMQKSLITYGELAEYMGYSDRRAGHTLCRQLGIIAKYCILNKLPTLNTIVVINYTDMPGELVIVRPNYTVKQEQSAVFKENWFNVRVPTTGTFRKVWEQYCR